MSRSEIKSIIESIMFAYGEPISIKELNYAINEELSPKEIEYMLNLLKIIPNSIICELCYKNIYRYDERINFKEYCYWITPAKYSKGIFKKEVFQKPINIKFEDTYLYAPSEIEDYLKNK